MITSLSLTASGSNLTLCIRSNNILSIKDLGSGLNFKKKGLNQLINMILNNEISTLILNHKERLLRFGSEVLFKLCDFYNIQVIILNEEVKDFNTDLTESVIEIMTVFCAKLYGKRSHKNKNSLKINPKITIIDLKKIKNCNRYISRIMNQYRKNL